MTNKYVLEHITDIAKIPEDEFGMFLNELSCIYHELRGISNIVGQANVKSVTPSLEWRADGSDHIDTELLFNGDTIAVLRTKEPTK